MKVYSFERHHTNEIRSKCPIGQDYRIKLQQKPPLAFTIALNLIVETTQADYLFFRTSPTLAAANFCLGISTDGQDLLHTPPLQNVS